MCNSETMLRLHRPATRSPLRLLAWHIVLAGVFPATVWAVNPVAWQVDITTSGQDVSWTSPTAVTLGLAEYDWSYEITKLTGRVLFADVNLLGLLETTSGAGAVSSLPIVLVDENLDEPTTGSSADIRIEVDAAGVGRASGENIVLGKFLGVPISRVNLQATVRILGVPTGDYDRDGDVDALDYGVWRGNLGSTTSLTADGNKNGIVDAGDYAIWRANLGVDATPAAAHIVSLPELGTSGGIGGGLLALLALMRRGNHRKRTSK